MGQPLNGREAVSVGYSDDERSVSVTGVGVPNVLLTTVNELERGDVLGSRYQIEAVIGTGGSGRVLRAFDRESRMPVALKILRPEFASDPVWTERFSRELRIGRTITHPNVCRVFDIGDADGHKFLSMELASRGSIRADVPKLGAARVTPTRPLRSWAERVADAQAVVDGVAALHAAGIVHRDLKPENILRMADGRLVVTDFGLATDPDAHGNTVMVGTPSYMAPEVVMGDPATKRSDVWGLGVVLHEILFGCRPQWKPAGRGYRKFVLPDEVTTPVQRATAELCGRCADDSADLRPSSAVEVRDELVRALRGKRRLSRAGTRQIAWGVVAVVAFGALAFVRERWSNRAEASLSSAAAPVAERVLTPAGTPEDWSKGAKKLATFPGRLHCYAIINGGRTLRTIWGTPRAVEDVDVRTGERTTPNLKPETFRDGCPVLSPDGERLLFERDSNSGPKVMLASVPNGDGAREIVRGSSPEWLPNGQEFAFILDGRHAAVFSLPTQEMTIVGDNLQPSRQLAEKAIDTTGTLLAVRYFTDTIDNMVVVHSLPSLAAQGSFLVPQSARGLRFLQENGGVLLSLDGGAGTAEMTLVNWHEGRFTRLGALPGYDVRGVLRAVTGSVVISRRFRKDLWLETASGLKRLTDDGVSDYGSRASNGTLVIQRRKPDGAYVIVVQDSNGQEKQITGGPLDMTPTVFSDGTRWIHANYRTRSLVECNAGNGTCSTLLTDSLAPQWPVVDPSGHNLAYISCMSMPRLHLVDLQTLKNRDLGPVAQECPPFWATAHDLWISQLTDGRRIWTKVDLSSGKRMEKTFVAWEKDQECQVPSEIRRGGNGFIESVAAIADEASLLTLRPNDTALAASD